LSLPELGREGEKRALTLLRGRGYKILARNYRCRHGEIDIVAFEGGEYVFVEVKARSGDAMGSALDAVTKAKQRKMARVAEQYLIERKLTGRPCRFDVVAIAASGLETADEVIRGAFTL
jgi:putative endonuclease